MLQSIGSQRVEHILGTATAKLLQSWPALCDPIDGSPPGSPIPGILQARTLEWVAISFSNAWKWKAKIESEVAQSCPTLHDPMDCSLPGSSFHGIFQARVLEWSAIAFSDLRDRESNTMKIKFFFISYHLIKILYRLIVIDNFSWKKDLLLVVSLQKEIKCTNTLLLKPFYFIFLW